MTDFDLIARSDAVSRVLDCRRSLLARDGPTETVSLPGLAGRTLAADVVAPEDRPGRSRATMDGYAVDASAEEPLSVRDGTVGPEDDPDPLDDGETVAVATGAPLPSGADAVCRREDAQVTDGRLSSPSIAPDTYVHERGSTVRAGETLFEAGERLSPKDALLLGDLGRESVPVRRRISVGLLATGAEIHDGTVPDLDAPMLAGLVSSWGGVPTRAGTVPDDSERVRSRISELAATHDVVVTTGGTSVGDRDHVVDALGALGTVRFHGVRLRPGKPVAVALLDDDAVAVAIPGKPFGAHVAATLVARPLFTGETALPTVPATAARAVEVGPTGFEYAVPVAADGGLSAAPDVPAVMPLGHEDSQLRCYREQFDPSVVSANTRATRADGLVVTETGFEAGERVDVVPFGVVE